MSNKVIVVPDTQVRDGVPTDHIPAISRYIVEQKPDCIVVIGDWWDMPSLSVFNTRLQADGLRIKRDLEAGYQAMDAFLKPIHDEQKRLLRNKKKQWNPRMIFTIGNHDPQVRIPRYIESHPELNGFLHDETTDYLEDNGFEVYGFGEIAEYEDIRFSHYFINPHSAKGSPAGGQIETMMKNVGFSFVQGHNQKGRWGKFYLGDGTVRIGVVAGCCYQHHETYMGVQGNNHWRGIIQLNEVRKGGADILELSLDYIMRKHG